MDSSLIGQLHYCLLTMYFCLHLSSISPINLQTRPLLDNHAPLSITTPLPPSRDYYQPLDSSLIGQLHYCLLTMYFCLSSLQVKYGYSEDILGHCVFNRPNYVSLVMISMFVFSVDTLCNIR